MKRNYSVTLLSREGELRTHYNNTDENNPVARDAISRLQELLEDHRQEIGKVKLIITPKRQNGI